jgi:hypothetical protein
MASEGPFWATTHHVLPPRVAVVPPTKHGVIPGRVWSSVLTQETTHNGGD